LLRRTAPSGAVGWRWRGVQRSVSLLRATSRAEAPTRQLEAAPCGPAGCSCGLSGLRGCCEQHRHDHPPWGVPDDGGDASGHGRCGDHDSVEHAVFLGTSQASSSLNRPPWSTNRVSHTDRLRRPSALVLSRRTSVSARRRETVKLLCRTSTCSAARSQGGAKLPTGGKCEPAHSPRALPGFV